MIGRTHMNGRVTESLIGQEVQLKGWVQKRRDLGGLIFIDLRDRTGIVQVVVRPENEAVHQLAETIRSEFVLDVKGTVLERENKNPNLPTGNIEVIASEINILNAAKMTPIPIGDEAENVSEDLRLKYRYLDLRRPALQETFRLRSKTSNTIRNFLTEQEFLEVETPILTKSTPEGARDYLVPSRVHGGEFYALPQSPQLFKQLLMVAGFDRYFQIARCFRDEDLRADRQPEFTQVDIETSFMDIEDLMAMMESMMGQVMESTLGRTDTPAKFERMTHAEAMRRFGSDKPDTRFGLELIDVADAVKGAGFKVFDAALESNGQVKAINVKGEADNFSRKDIDKLQEFTAVYGAKGLAWLKVTAEGLNGPIAKFFDETYAQKLIEATDAEAGDLLLFVASKPTVVADSLGALRVKLGHELGLIDESKFNFLWVTDFPLVTFEEEDGRFYANHHPFTMPNREDLHLLETDPASVRAVAYDLVLNGYELGGGSQRIYERDIQERMFKLLGFTQEEAVEQFGFLLEAFEYGTPPHAGIALGLDRLVMILAGRSNLRDTIAFPKTASASCLLTQAPSPVADAQLEELSIRTAIKEKK
ncbi:aspartyl-tRNA synthetase, promiscuous (also recognizes tRNAasn) [Exiguobacterium sp. 8H]|uniref:aspartate--tRNA ligase n=1 Tax=unclassified Exiguobacterium TaxID=2644629 RepID=UPI0012EF8E53|nr:MULTISPECIES: aspartate--tRNA ligase [unclassified Exiguobacterium]VXA98975.1 aspartyl-tRNA synthetase, promiscuous (also recognizes tRNAasn) [Exiguobacterium sp. 8A]VXA99421.1 aspartyl-tRNA synthetase, promiscuous (also recognizes tRNAasn) [Exiguobacterium sp. 8H]